MLFLHSLDSSSTFAFIQQQASLPVNEAV